MEEEFGDDFNSEISKFHQQNLPIKMWDHMYIQFFWAMINLLSYYAYMTSFLYIPASLIWMVSFYELSILRFYIIILKHGIFHPKVISYYVEGFSLSFWGSVLILICTMADSETLEQTTIGILLIILYTILKTLKNVILIHVIRNESDSVHEIYKKEFQYGYKISLFVWFAIYCLSFTKYSLEEYSNFYIDMKIILLFLVQIFISFLTPGFEITLFSEFSMLDLNVNFWKSVFTWIFFILIYRTESFSYTHLIALISWVWGEYILIMPMKAIQSNQ